MPKHQTRRSFLAAVPVAAGSANLLDTLVRGPSKTDPGGFTLWYRKPANAWTERVFEKSGRLRMMPNSFYETDLTNTAWELISPLLPGGRHGGRPRNNECTCGIECNRPCCK